MDWRSLLISVTFELINVELIKVNIASSHVGFTHHQLQKSRLTGAGRPDKKHEFPVFDLK